MERYPMSDKRLSKTELKALLALWDDGPGTCGQLKVTPSVMAKLVRYGLASELPKRPLTYVGKTITLYSLSERGRREVLLTGKRFVPRLAT
jgi:hypothetical protein